MSYWVKLAHDDLPVEVEQHEEGGTYILGGSKYAELNITYNYSLCYRLANFSIKDLDNKKAGDTIHKLQEVIDKLGTKQYSDYWAPTPGNAGHAANVLLTWAKEHPTAIWKVN